jgi:bifunctional enzyme CysN/CysC
MENNIPSSQEKMDIVFVGHVDHGKSTVIGRLLADTNSLPDGKLEQVKQTCALNQEPFEYSYLIDALKDERAQSITIDAARVFFKTQKRHYIIIDAPGHIEFIKNMVTGAARAEAAVLVIDANEGVQENSRRHGYLLGMLGINQIIVVVNKMDMVDYDETVYRNIENEYTKYLNQIGLVPKCFIPISGKEGINLTNLSHMTTWFKGEPLLETLDSFKKLKTDTEKPFRLPVQDIYKFTTYGDGRRIVAGTVLSGKSKIGDKLTFYPSGKNSHIKSIEEYDGPSPTSISTTQAVGITLTEQIYITRGEVACLENEPAPYISPRFKASMFWLGKNSMELGKEYVLKLGTTRVSAKIETINKIINADKLDNKMKNQIDQNDVAEVVFELDRPIAYDTSDSLSDLSRFVILDNYHIWGGGIVLESLPDKDNELREDVYTRNQRWIHGKISPRDRAERFNQNSGLVIITGNPSSGRKKLAGMLENQLFTEGKYTYYLGLGNVKYGLSLDLMGGNSKSQSEQIRRIAELAYMFLDAGILLILTGIEFTEDDLDIFRTVVGYNKINVVWCGDEITTDIENYLHVPSDELFEKTVIRIKKILQKDGYIFQPRLES